MKSALEEIGVVVIHLKSLMDVQETMLRQVMEHLLPLLVEEKKGKDSDEVLHERLSKLDEMIKSDAWRTPGAERNGQRKEKEADVGRNYREHRKEDEDKSGVRGVGESSEDGRRLFDMVV